MLGRPDEPMHLGAETPDPSGCLTASKGCLGTTVVWLTLELLAAAVFSGIAYIVFDGNDWLTLASLLLVVAVIAVIESRRRRSTD